MILWPHWNYIQVYVCIFFIVSLFTNSIILPTLWLRYTNINFCADGTTAVLFSLYWMSISTGNPRGAVFSQDFSPLAFHRNFLIFRSVRCHTCVITRCDAHKRSLKLYFFAKVSEIRSSSYWKLLHIFIATKKSITHTCISSVFLLLAILLSFQSLSRHSGNGETYGIQFFLCSFSLFYCPNAKLFEST